MYTHQITLDTRLLILSGKIAACVLQEWYDFYARGTPGIDWDVNNPSQSDITKVFYTAYDSSVSSLYSKCIISYLYTLK